MIQIKPVPRPTTEYQQFVKDNMTNVKSQHPYVSQGGIMSIMGQLYRETKAAKLSLGNGSADMNSLSNAMDGLGYEGESNGGFFDDNELLYPKDDHGADEEEGGDDIEPQLDPFSYPEPFSLQGKGKASSYIDLTEDDESAVAWCGKDRFGCGDE